ncbi:MAG: phage tail family protein [Clostridium sp.]
MPYGIRFDNEKHTYTDFGLRIKSINIDMPDVKLNRIELPGSDGCLDMTDYFGTKYENRKITVTCDQEDRSYERWTSAISRMSNYLHGKKRKLVLDWDSGYYYVGRGKCEYDKDNRIYSEITLVFDCEPYKYELIPLILKPE